MTYKQIQEEYRKRFSKAIKSCWIADVKRELGMPVRMAYNREKVDIIKNRCPERYKESIKDIILKGNSRR